jgi:hypothetical protein
MDNFKLIKFSSQVYNIFLKIQYKIQYCVLMFYFFYIYIYIYISNVCSINPILIGPIMIIAMHELCNVIE